MQELYRQATRTYRKGDSKRSFHANGGDNARGVTPLGVRPVRARHDQLTNAALAAWFSVCRCAERDKESPGRTGALRSSRMRKRRARPAPTPVGPSTGYFSFRTYFGDAPTRPAVARRAGTCHLHRVGRQAQMTNGPTQWLAHGSVSVDARRTASIKKAPGVPGL
jgi:hypothetical protein